MADYDVGVIGGGLAGLSAALQAARLGASVVLLEGEPTYGGLVANVGRLDDLLAGHAPPGAAVADALVRQARDEGVEFVVSQVDALRASGGDFTLDHGGKRVVCAGVVLAVGRRMRRLAVPGEEAYSGRGVSRCDWCDGGLYRGKSVAVIGGGTAALQAALHLSDMCAGVAVIARSASLRARRDYVLRAADVPNIEFVWETSVEAFLGGDALEALLLRAKGEDKATRRELDAAFIFAGLEPALKFLELPLERDPDGYIAANDLGATSCPGAFAAGTVRRAGAGSALVAMGDGTRVAGALVEHLRANERIN